MLKKKISKENFLIGLATMLLKVRLGKLVMLKTLVLKIKSPPISYLSNVKSI